MSMWPRKKMEPITKMVKRRNKQLEQALIDIYTKQLTKDQIHLMLVELNLYAPESYYNNNYDDKESKDEPKL